MKSRISLFAQHEREDCRSKIGDPLVGLTKHVDFDALAASIDAAAPRPSRAKGGRPPYATVLTVKILVENYGKPALGERRRTQYRAIDARARRARPRRSIFRDFSCSASSIIRRGVVIIGEVSSVASRLQYFYNLETVGERRKIDHECQHHYLRRASNNAKGLRTQGFWCTSACRDASGSRSPHCKRVGCPEWQRPEHSRRRYVAIDHHRQTLDNAIGTLQQHQGRARRGHTIERAWPGARPKRRTAHGQAEYFEERCGDGDFGRGSSASPCHGRAMAKLAQRVSRKACP